MSSTDAFEEQGTVPDDQQADRLAMWFNDYLDKERFRWLAAKMSDAERGLAETYAKLWTVSLQSNQNTATRYRMLRKEQQEKVIAAALAGMGLTFQEKLGSGGKGKRPGGIDSADDVQPKCYVKEKKIIGRSQKRQKSDLTARPSEKPDLFCIEAKAVGIKLDSTKRLKELNDKYTDWKGSGLPITTIGVLAGMFSDTELVATIKQRRIPIFFEHALDKLVEFLRDGLYYRAPWEPARLFEEVPAAEVSEALESIQTAPLDDVADAEQKADGEPGDK
jgi:hypothetical protein